MEQRPVTLFPLTPTQKQTEIVQSLESSILTSQTSFDLQRQFEHIADNILRLGTGYRLDVPKTLVLFINKPRSDLTASSKAVATLQQKGVKLIVVGVGDGVTDIDLLPLVDGDKDIIRNVKAQDKTDEILDVNSITEKGKRG